jgi:hypothetical protein
MTPADRLRQQAERCLRLASATLDQEVADALNRLAAESLAQAAKLENEGSNAGNPQRKG